MLSALISSAPSPAMRLATQPGFQWCVLRSSHAWGAAPTNSPTPTANRDRTVSRRSKPSSRPALNGEQPYPWDLLQPQDVMSRHPEVPNTAVDMNSWAVSAYYPRYLLSVERWPSIPERVLSIPFVINLIN